MRQFMINSYGQNIRILWSWKCTQEGCVPSSNLQDPNTKQKFTSCILWLWGPIYGNESFLSLFSRYILPIFLNMQLISCLNWWAIPQHVCKWMWPWHCVQRVLCLLLFEWRLHTDEDVGFRLA